MSWLLRNRSSLIIAGASALVLVAVHVGLALIDRVQTGPLPTVVAFGESGELSGYTFTLVDAELVPGGELEVPRGTQLVVANLTVQPGPDAANNEPTSCTGVLVDPDDREWRAVFSPYEFGYGDPFGTGTTCSLQGESFDYRTVFLTPEGVGPGAVVEIRLILEQRVLQLQLPPL